MQRQRLEKTNESGQRARWLAALFAVAAFVCGASRSVHASADRLRVLLRVTGSSDLTLGTRLRGQASDLPVDFTDVPQASLEPTLAERLNVADLLVRQLRGDVVIWFDGHAASLYVARPAPGYLLTLDLPHGDAKSSGSAELEQTALRLRRALKTLLDGGVVGTKRDEALAPSAPLIAPAAAVSEGAVRVLFSLGMQQLFDGVQSSATGLSTRSGVGLGIFELSLSVDLYRDRRMTATFSKLALTRRTFAVEAGMQLLRTERVHVVAVGAVGVASFDVKERSRDDDSRTGFDDASRPVGTAGLRLLFPFWRPGPTTRVSFWAGGFLDVVGGAPRFPAYREAFSPSTFAPRVALGCQIQGG